MTHTTSFRKYQVYSHALSKKCGKTSLGADPNFASITSVNKKRGLSGFPHMSGEQEKYGILQYIFIMGLMRH